MTALTQEEKELADRLCKACSMLHLCNDGNLILDAINVEPCNACSSCPKLFTVDWTGKATRCPFAPKV